MLMQQSRGMLRPFQERNNIIEILEIVPQQNLRGRQCSAFQKCYEFSLKSKSLPDLRLN